ncbi:MAG: zinc-ribbon domain-containing protein [Candidatus Woesearchaeota archaeon]
MARRKPLPYWVFLLVGALISGYAWFIKRSVERVNAEAMQLFIYVGLGFLVLGLLKLLMKWLKNYSTKEKQFAEQLGGVDEINRDEAALLKKKQGRQQGQNAPPRVILCPKCRTKNYSTSNFCHMCGYRLN